MHFIDKSLLVVSDDNTPSSLVHRSRRLSTHCHEEATTAQTGEGCGEGMREAESYSRLVPVGEATVSLSPGAHHVRWSAGKVATGIDGGT